MGGETACDDLARVRGGGLIFSDIEEENGGERGKGEASRVTLVASRSIRGHTDSPRIGLTLKHGREKAVGNAYRVTFGAFAPWEDIRVGVRGRMAEEAVVREAYGVTFVISRSVGQMGSAHVRASGLTLKILKIKWLCPREKDVGKLTGFRSAHRAPSANTRWTMLPGGASLRSRYLRRRANKHLPAPTKRCQQEEQASDAEGTDEAVDAGGEGRRAGASTLAGEDARRGARGAEGHGGGGVEPLHSDASTSKEGEKMTHVLDMLPAEQQSVRGGFIAAPSLRIRLDLPRGGTPAHKEGCTKKSRSASARPRATILRFPAVSYVLASATAVSAAWLDERQLRARRGVAGTGGGVAGTGTVMIASMGVESARALSRREGKGRLALVEGGPSTTWILCRHQAEGLGLERTIPTAVGGGRETRTASSETGLATGGEFGFGFLPSG
ncbi:hypothetical protein FB451DRAFT_1365806 [Mycena latifolia]|nr:hypothetical protein FB451DRAFT_1365806 [Mycena latifolia]